MCDSSVCQYRLRLCKEFPLVQFSRLSWRRSYLVFLHSQRTWDGGGPRNGLAQLRRRVRGESGVRGGSVGRRVEMVLTRMLWAGSFSEWCVIQSWASRDPKLMWVFDSRWRYAYSVKVSYSDTVSKPATAESALMRKNVTTWEDCDSHTHQQSEFSLTHNWQWKRLSLVDYPAAISFDIDVCSSAALRTMSIGLNLLVVWISRKGVFMGSNRSAALDTAYCFSKLK